MLHTPLRTGAPALLLLLAACGSSEPSATKLLTAQAAPPATAPPAAAAPSAPAEPTVERQLLILTGGTDAATVEQWVARHQEPLAELYGSTEPLPIIQSDGIEGLKPGFFILAPAVCAADEASEAFYAALHEIPGAYVRTVQVPEDFGTCRPAKTTEWWVLLMNDADPFCNLWREKVQPMPEVVFDDPNVIPPPPEGTWALQGLHGPCPAQWSAEVSESGAQMLLHGRPEADLSATSVVFSVDLLDSDGLAEPFVPGAPFESVTYDGEVPVVHFIDRSVPEVPADAPLDGQVELVYEGSLETIFAAAGLSDRVVKGLEQSEVRRMVSSDTIHVFACVAARLEGTTWVEQSRRIATVSEGSLPPYCTDRRQANNLGFRDASLKGGAVSQSLIGELNRVAGAPDRTQWHFVGMSGVGKGDLAVSTHTEIGSNLTGFAVAWDGETARPLDKLQGTVTNIRDLDHGRALVCTDKGHGAYQSRTGKQLWWKRGPRCPVVFRE